MKNESQSKLKAVSNDRQSKIESRASELIAEEETLNLNQETVGVIKEMEAGKFNSYTNADQLYRKLDISDLKIRQQPVAQLPSQL